MNIKKFILILGTFLLIFTNFYAEEPIILDLTLTDEDLNKEFEKNTKKDKKKEVKENIKLKFIDFSLFLSVNTGEIYLEDDEGNSLKEETEEMLLSLSIETTVMITKALRIGAGYRALVLMDSSVYERYDISDSGNAFPYGIVEWGLETEKLYGSLFFRLGFDDKAKVIEVGVRSRRKIFAEVLYGLSGQDVKYSDSELSLKNENGEVYSAYYGVAFGISTQ